eukprot:TRINITY_DN12118_c0_g1_i1.p2 TRINITY_DN12118_c0_g1~~TRINITY_DN12118_c0_g1_i1.p2  ORF type:complete len:117 (-),score=9.36 TRINITY_DN12118_c0_g1_i1:558-908(-)
MLAYTSRGLSHFIWGPSSRKLPHFERRLLAVSPQLGGPNARGFHCCSEIVLGPRKCLHSTYWTTIQCKRDDQPKSVAAANTPTGPPTYSTSPSTKDDDSSDVVDTILRRSVADVVC